MPLDPGVSLANPPEILTTTGGSPARLTTRNFRAVVADTDDGFTEFISTD
jgi:hypothetical protein